ncbi:MAG: hypothetical protein KC800_21435 [Candidatus Eremiobacteraeota bacterium]|nr:hypothetical protein [Candidatus Eremiobacteraeota bacterium]
MKQFLCLLGLLLITGCSSHQTESLSVETFNAQTAEAHSTGSADWPQSCLLVALRFVGDRDVCSRTIEISSKPERFEQAEVTITEEGLLDDSVDGHRHRLTLHKTSEGYWVLDSAQRSWKCVSGRGHTGYSCEPCS